MRPLIRGVAVLQPWALAIEQRAKERYGVEAQVTATNDGIIARLPDVESAPPGADLVAIGPPNWSNWSPRAVAFGEALFASSSECAARACCSPAATPAGDHRCGSSACGRRNCCPSRPTAPRSSSRTARYLEDVFDLPGLTALLGDVAARRVRLVEVGPRHPLRQVADVRLRRRVHLRRRPTLAEHQARRISLDPALLAKLLDREGGAATPGPDVVGPRRGTGLPQRVPPVFQREQLSRTCTTGLDQAECRSASDDPKLTRPAGRAAGSRSSAPSGSPASRCWPLLTAQELLRDWAFGPPPCRLLRTTRPPDTREVGGALDQTHVVTTPRRVANRYGLPRGQRPLRVG